ncbi:MAG: thioredoxin family protein [bacterium]
MKQKNSLLSFALALSLASIFSGCECPLCKHDDKSAIRSSKSENASTEIIDEASFEKAIQDSKLSIIKFSTTWCSACNVYAPNFENVARDLKNNYNFYSIDADKLSGLSKKNGIQGIPTTIFFKNGKKITELVGAAAEPELKAKIEEANK